MRGLWLEAGRLELREDLPEPVGEEVLVRVELAGICNTDLELLRGYFEFTGVPGHEFVGVVAESRGRWEAGQRVVGEINAGCHRCSTCRAGRPRHCPQRTVLGIQGRDGAFREYLSLPEENLHAVPDGIADEAAVFVEPLAAAVRILEQVHLSPSERVLLIGAGKLGQLIARVLRLTGCELQVLARHRHQQERLERLGIAALLDFPESLHHGFDAVVEASGTPAGLATALQALRPEGLLILKSTYADRVSLDVSRLVVDEVRWLGSRCGPFPPALRLLEEGLVDPRDLVEAVYPLEDFRRAFSHAGRPGAYKILLAMRS
ncbi:MAG: alcohol dehydrogenase catalytic domain-containing protein [Acidobacteriota bacterium]